MTRAGAMRVRRRHDRRLHGYFPGRCGIDVIVVKRTDVAAAASGKAGGILALDRCAPEPARDNRVKAHVTQVGTALPRALSRDSEAIERQVRRTSRSLASPMQKTVRSFPVPAASGVHERLVLAVRDCRFLPTSKVVYEPPVPI
jgi:hypothetical protein